MKYLWFLLLINLISSVDAKLSRVYHPYVIPFEKELEYRSIFQETESPTDTQLLQILGYGQSITEDIFLEFYIVSDQFENDNTEITAYEGEALIQLTEQGEYSADWGLLFELEKITALSKWEAKSGLLVESEWGKWSGTLNLFIIFEFGDEYDDEWHTALASQWRYRYSQFIEPSVELYSSEYGASIGPAISGQIRLDANKLNWELGYQFGLDDDAPESYWRASLEFEF